MNLGYSRFKLIKMYIVYSLFVLCIIVEICFCNGNTTKRKTEDYYLNYDYDVKNNSVNIEVEDNIILPNIEKKESKYVVDVLPKVELPDDSLADTDLKDHDFIDNIMYVYYGSTNRNTNAYGAEIIIIGSVLSLAPQLLTLFCVLFRKDKHVKWEIKQLFLHFISCFCISNLLFMMGVFATKNHLKCLVISLVLHYLHLLTAVWLFLYCYYVNKIATMHNYNYDIVNVKFLSMIAYNLPIILTLLSYIISPESYETRRFCFISVLKGMIVNYLLPVFVLITLTTLYSLNGICKLDRELSKLTLNSSVESLNALKTELDVEKREDDAEVKSLTKSKNCLRLLCKIQNFYNLVWFMAVLALENYNGNTFFYYVYAICSCILSWLIFIKTKSLLPTIHVMSDVMVDIITETMEPNLQVPDQSETNSLRDSSDNIPLLNAETDLKELQQEYISTITS